MKLVHVIQHTSAEYLGLIEDHLEGRSIRFRYHRPFAAKGTLPPLEAIADGLILLGGGPWGAAGTSNLPTLEPEVALARACLERAWPLIGIGLGAQIIALAAGGRSDPAALEFSVTTARRIAAGALGGYLPETYPLAIYMRDWPVVPDGAEVLARDPAGRPALWQIGPKALAFVAHPGLKVAMIEDLIMEFEDSPSNVDSELDRLRAVQRPLEDALVPIMTGLVQWAGWMEDAAAKA
jgi:GMP synthase-like glutamine amidotransferase